MSIVCECEIQMLLLNNVLLWIYWADNKSDAWRNLWTISMHKIFAAVAMGIALLKLIPKRPFFLTVVYSFAFGISSPIGVGIGIAINSTSQGAVSDWIYAITMSLACGVFVYVAVNHLISKGYKPREECYFDKPIYKFLAVFLGVALLAIVMIWDWFCWHFRVSFIIICFYISLSLSSSLLLTQCKSSEKKYKCKQSTYVMNWW